MRVARSRAVRRRDERAPRLRRRKNTGDALVPFDHFKISNLINQYIGRWSALLLRYEKQGGPISARTSKLEKFNGRSYRAVQADACHGKGRPVAGSTERFGGAHHRRSGIQGG